MAGLPPPPAQVRALMGPEREAAALAPESALKNTLRFIEHWRLGGGGYCERQIGPKRGFHDFIDFFDFLSEFDILSVLQRKTVV